MPFNFQNTNKCVCVKQVYRQQFCHWRCWTFGPCCHRTTLSTALCIVEETLLTEWCAVCILKFVTRKSLIIVSQWQTNNPNTSTDIIMFVFRNHRILFIRCGEQNTTEFSICFTPANIHLCSVYLIFKITFCGQYMVQLLQYILRKKTSLHRQWFIIVTLISV
jgi:hypothetical protein